MARLAYFMDPTTTPPIPYRAFLLVSLPFLILWAARILGSRKQHPPFPPGPPRDPLVGHMRIMPTKDQVGVFQEWAKTYGGSWSPSSRCSSCWLRDLIFVKRRCSLHNSSSHQPQPPHTRLLRSCTSAFGEPRSNLQLPAQLRAVQIDGVEPNVDVLAIWNEDVL